MKKYLHFYILIVGIIIFLLGVTYGVYFAFPYPDLPPEKADEWHFDDIVSSLAMGIGVGLSFFGLLFGIVRGLRKHKCKK
jgi:vacuolar-type H+-ATPase subunit I/STV1